MDEKPMFQPADKETSADKSTQDLGVDELASNLHFVDMLYMNSMGKSTHPAVAATPDNPDIYENLRVLSCTDGSKRTCWTCDNQICDGCRASKSNIASHVISHRNCCIAYCTKCFLENKIHHPTTNHYRARRGPCVCYNQNRRNAGYSTSPADYPSNTDRNTKQFVCRTCAGLSPEQLVAKRDKIVREELGFLARQVKSCGKCAGNLGATGPRWWVCTKCDKECRDKMHIPWA